MKNFLKEIANSLRSCVVAAYSAFDMQDIFVFGGVGMLWYGLNMRCPWIAYAVCGAIIAAFGFFSAWAGSRPSGGK